MSEILVLQCDRHDRYGSDSLDFGRLLQLRFLNILGRMCVFLCTGRIDQPIATTE